MKIHNVEQYTSEWNHLHIGLPTASGLDNLLDSNWKLRTGETPKTYLHKKLAESWRGKPLIDLSASSFAMEQGLVLEDEVRPWFEFTFGKKLDRVGFITTDDGKFGCSPDAMLLNEKIGLEIKSPAAHTHVKYLLGGGVPKEYLAQVHGSMFATGYGKWVFLSYRRGFPVLYLEVERDEAIQLAIGEAVTKFHSDFEAGKGKLKSLVKESEARG